MAEDTENMEEKPKKRSKKGLVPGLVAAILFGGGGFYATYSGLVGGLAKTDAHSGPEEVAAEPLPEIAFVPLDPLIISLGPAGVSRHLRFGAELEVGASHAEDVTLLMPRILDVLNGYLRAVDVALLEDPAALIRLRAQMLRRVRMVAGEGRVRDLLVTEFVLN